jgi:hypothetical protein
MDSSERPARCIWTLSLSLDASSFNLSILIMVKSFFWNVSKNDRITCWIGEYGSWSALVVLVGAEERPMEFGDSGIAFRNSEWPLSDILLVDIFLLLFVSMLLRWTGIFGTWKQSWNARKLKTAYSNKNNGYNRRQWVVLEIALFWLKRLKIEDPSPSFDGYQLNVYNSCLR